MLAENASLKKRKGELTDEIDRLQRLLEKIQLEGKDMLALEEEQRARERDEMLVRLKELQDKNAAVKIDLAVSEQERSD